MGRTVHTTAVTVEVAQVADLPADMPDVVALITDRVPAAAAAGEDAAPPPESALVAAPSSGTLVLKHAISMRPESAGVSPLPEALMLAARLHHLCNEYLGTAESAGGAGAGGPTDGDEQKRRFVREQVSSLAAKAAAGADLPASVELLALLDVINIVNVRVGLAAEEAAGQRAPASEAAAALEAERVERQSQIVEAVMLDVHARMRKQVRRVLRKGVMPARAAPNVGELNLRIRELEGSRARDAKLCTLLMGRVEACLATTALGVTYMWLVGLLRHENAARCCLCPDAWPLAAAEPGEADADAARWEEVLRDDEGGRNAFLRTYRDKMLMWGCWVISQWTLHETISHVDISQFGRESVTLRNQHSWSVPTREALDLIATHGPLVEIGAGNAVWTELLLKRGVDVVAFDTLRWSDEFNDNGQHEQGTVLVGARPGFVREGGPEVLLDGAVSRVRDVSGERARSLMLMWPDYMGHGEYGLRCLENYRGDVLILVGEWQKETCGAYTTGVPTHGQSFSKRFQERVEAEFERSTRCRLPTWPLFFDTLAVWRRRDAVVISPSGSEQTLADWKR